MMDPRAEWSVIVGGLVERFFIYSVSCGCKASTRARSGLYPYLKCF